MSRPRNPLMSLDLASVSQTHCQRQQCLYILLQPSLVSFDPSLDNQDPDDWAST